MITEQSRTRITLPNWRGRRFFIVGLLALLVLIGGALYYRYASASVGIALPDTDISSSWPECSTACQAAMQYEYVNDGLSTDTADWIGTGLGGSGGEAVEFGLTTLDSVSTVSSIELCVNAQSVTNANGGTLDTLSIAVRIGGVLQTAAIVTPAFNSWTDYCTTYTGSWSKAEIDGMQAHIMRNREGSGNPSGQIDNVRISNVNVSLVFTSPSALTQSGYRWFENVDTANFSTTTSNPTTASDAAYATVQDGSSLYTAGYGGSNGIDWRVEKRNLSDGALVSGFGSSGVLDINPSASDDRIWGLDVDDSYIYLVGDDRGTGSTNPQWRIEKRDKTTGALVAGFGSGGVIQNNPSAGIDGAREIKVDATHMYIIGIDEVSGAGRWRVEKRDKVTGALVTSFGSNGVVATDYDPTDNDDAAALVMDDTSLYIGGFDAIPASSNQLRIEKRDKTTGSLVSSFGSGGAITEDIFTGNAGTIADDAVFLKGLHIDNGNLFVAGSDMAPGNLQWRVEKRDSATGSLVSGFGSGGVVQSDFSSADDTATFIEVSGTGVYIGGSDRSLDGGMSQWRIEKRDYTTGALVTSFGNSGVILSNPSTGHDEVRDAALFNDNLYLIGYDFSQGNYQWRVEKRNTLNGQGPSDSSTPMATLNTPVTSVATNEQVRLRFLLRVGTEPLGAGARQFKLQFAEQSGTCDISFAGETYSDVTTVSAIAYYNNAALTDSSSAYVNVNDPTDGSNPVLAQSYEEINNFTSVSSSIPVNSNGLWDASLYNRSAPDGKTYCFRVVESTGTVLSSYVQLPELSTPPSQVPTLTQANYRWFQNSNSSTPGATLALQDEAAAVEAGVPFRLRQRIAVDTGNLSPNQKNLKLQYALRSGVCDVGFSGEVYRDVPSGATGSPQTRSAGSGYTLAGAPFGAGGWSNTLNVDASDDARAYESVYGGYTYTEYLATKAHGFNIPSGATITNITVDAEVAKGGALEGTVSDYSVRLIKNGVAVGDDWLNLNSQAVSSWTPTDTTISYGGDGLWGTTWTAEDINDPDFGVGISAAIDDPLGDGVSAMVDHISITVEFVGGTPDDILFHNNSAVASFDPISSLATDPVNGARSVVYNSYHESNPFTNSTATIPSGSDGLWDFSLTSVSGAGGSSYCFRFVDDSGTPLESYVNIAEITLENGGGGGASSLEQQLRGGQAVVDGTKHPFAW